MSEEHNEWELSSGLALDGAVATITGFEFGFNANIGANVLCANATFTPVEGGDDIEQSFSVGQGWDANRTGDELVSERPKSINKNTNFGVLIQSAVDCLGGDGAALGGSPRHASTWLGTTWKMGTIKRKTVNPTTKAETEKDAFVFVEYHGREGAEATSDPAPAAKTPAAKKAAGAAKAAGAHAGIPDELWDELVALAGEHAEHDDFMEAALDLPAVESNKDAQKAIMGTRAGSVWAAKS